MKNENSKFGFRLLLFIWLLTQKCAARDIFNLTFAYCDIKCFLMSVCLLSHHFKETWQVSASTTQQLAKWSFPQEFVPLVTRSMTSFFEVFVDSLCSTFFPLGRSKGRGKNSHRSRAKVEIFSFLSSKSDQWVVEDLPWRELNIVPPWKPPRST